MLRGLLLGLSLMVAGSMVQTADAVHVVMCGGPALKRWEGLRIQPDRHDNWWANFVRGSTVRIGQLLAQDPSAQITWIVYRPGYLQRGKEDGKPYVQWINDLARKYKVKLVWVNSGKQAIAALNKTPRHQQDFVQTFYYFGHSNPYAFMLDYSSDIMGVSTEWIHETDLNQISAGIFRPESDCWSFGCYTGMSMSGWWKKFLGVHLWGNMKSTHYRPVSNGQLPSGGGKWVR